MELTGCAALITSGKWTGAAVLASAGAEVALSYNSSKANAEQTAVSVLASATWTFW